MTIEKRPNATADKNAPTQAPRPAPIVSPGTGPKLPGPPGVPGTERFRLLAYVKQESMVRVDKRPDETVLTWPHLLRAEFLMAMLISRAAGGDLGLHPRPAGGDGQPGRNTPHVAKAPWYFLGLQEILSYFNATVAGVIVPPSTWSASLAIPFIDRTPVQGGARPQAHVGLLHVPDGRRPDGHLHRLVLPRPGLELGLAVGGALLHPMTQHASLRRGPRSADRRDDAGAASCVACWAWASASSPSSSSGLAGIPVAEPDRGARRRDLARDGGRHQCPSHPSGQNGLPYVYNQANLFFVNVPASKARVEGDGTVASGVPDPGTNVDEELPFSDRSVMALWRKCPHLGCQVPQLCNASQWFECLCHGVEVHGPRREAGRAGAAWHGPLPGRRGGRRVRREHGGGRLRPAARDRYLRRACADRHAALHGLGDAAQDARRHPRDGDLSVHRALLAHRWPAPRGGRGRAR